MKHTLEKVDNRITEAEGWISELEDRMSEVTAMEENKEKRMKRNKDSFRDVWENIQWTNIYIIRVLKGKVFLHGSHQRESACNSLQFSPPGRPGSDPWDGESPWKTEWQPSPVFWPGEFHGQRSRARYSPWGCRESDTTKWLSTGKTRKLWMEKLTSKGKCAEMRGNHPHTNMISKPANIRSSVQSLAQSFPTLWDPMDHRTPGLPVHHQLP